MFKKYRMIPQKDEKLKCVYVDCKYKNSKHIAIKNSSYYFDIAMVSSTFTTHLFARCSEHCIK